MLLASFLLFYCAQKCTVWLVKSVSRWVEYEGEGKELTVDFWGKENEVIFNGAIWLSGAKPEASLGYWKVLKSRNAACFQIFLAQNWFKARKEFSKIFCRGNHNYNYQTFVPIFARRREGVKTLNRHEVVKSKKICLKGPFYRDVWHIFACLIAYWYHLVSPTKHITIYYIRTLFCPEKCIGIGQKCCTVQYRTE